MILTVHHIGYLSKSIQNGIREMQALGYSIVHEVIRDERRGVDITFLVSTSRGLNTRIELISPYTEESVVFNLLKKRGSGAYHICYECDCFEKDIESLIGSGYKLIQPPEEAVALDNRRVCFLYNKDVGIIELLEGV